MATAKPSPTMQCVWSGSASRRPADLVLREPRRPRPQLCGENIPRGGPSSTVTATLTLKTRKPSLLITHSSAHVPGAEMSGRASQCGHLSQHSQSSESYLSGTCMYSACGHTLSLFIAALETSDIHCGPWWLGSDQFITIDPKNAYFRNYSSILGRSICWKMYLRQITSKQVLFHPQKCNKVAGTAPSPWAPAGTPLRRSLF